ncbi:MAG TPA: glutamate synthase subunit alpha, partial [Hyphomicrobiales bacterium]|nr:glutamate synthase subunit alpha [Hyphomicrobiales bacterium]
MTTKRDETLLASALRPSAPPAQGLFDPALEKDSCGVGFIADLSNRKSHAIVEHGLTILQNLEHRGAVGADPRAGDGAGILVQIPHRFFQGEAERLGFALPAPGHYAVGYLFMPRDPEGRRIIRETVERVIESEGQVLLGWRDVPTDNAILGESVKPTEPLHVQVFIGRGPGIADEDAFERRLYILRKVVSGAVHDAADPRTAGFYP